jgi:hypothetical protein
MECDKAVNNTGVPWIGAMAWPTAGRCRVGKCALQPMSLLRALGQDPMGLAMPFRTISQIYLGAIDGKHEYLDSSPERRAHSDSFMMPRTINERSLLAGQSYLVKGFRGTGKTSLLRWVAQHLKSKGEIGSIVLFKSDISESKRVEISKAVGMQYVQVDSKTMGVSQDFKEAWRWFLHQKICEILIEHDGAESSAEMKKYTQLLGLSEHSWFDKAVAGLPRFDAARVKVKALQDFISAEFGLELTAKNQSSISVSSVVDKLDFYLARIKIRRPIFLCLDELEVFYHTPEQYKRDLSMVRDLLFSVSGLTHFFQIKSKNIKIYAGIRTEVMDAMGSDGQELSRLVGDCGVSISWHNERRSLDHQLFHMVRRKIWSSEAKAGFDLTPDPIAHYFPKTVAGLDLDVFLLDQSFYKPRDLIIRLKCAQDQAFENSMFTSALLSRTEKEYSSKMWEEAIYELSATYSQDEIRVVEGLFIGHRPQFNREEIAQRLRNSSTGNRIAEDLMRKKSIDYILRDLYRIGAIGNYFGSEASNAKQRWIFRGDPHLDESRSMGLHAALFKHLSIVRPKRQAA